MIVGRNEEENKTLLRFLGSNDVALEVIGVGSPIILLKKQKNEDDIQQATKLCFHYNDAKKKEEVLLKIKYGNGEEELHKIQTIKISMSKETLK